MYQAPRGTKDLLPEDSPTWRLVEAEARRQARLANFGEIRTPTFEHSAVFQRGVGAATDIVEKEMYTFVDKGGDSMTLRPEGTAAVIRAYIQHGMSSRPQPLKLFSVLTLYRHDNPQQGRFREFHQFNAEAIGEADPLADAELVALQWRFYVELGLRGLSLRINSIGDGACRPAYLQRLAEHFARHESALCTDCRRRLDTNPLRLLDCKNVQCQPALDEAPRSADFLCAPCREHHGLWTTYLDSAGIPFTAEPRLVRGLDYYTRSVWEVWPEVAGSQSTLGGGGRYDGLAEQLGGRPTPGVGFATGIERVILNLKEQDIPAPTPPPLTAFIVCQHANAKGQAFRLAEMLRAKGLSVDLSVGERKLGKQLAAADRSGARFAIILGEKEMARGAVGLKDLRQGGEQRVVDEAELHAALAGPNDA